MCIDCLVEVPFRELIRNRLSSGPCVSPGPLSALFVLSSALLPQEAHPCVSPQQRYAAFLVLQQRVGQEAIRHRPFPHSISSSLQTISVFLIFVLRVQATLLLVQFLT